jgi:hypothetical protein
VQLLLRNEVKEVHGIKEHKAGGDAGLVHLRLVVRNVNPGD